MSWLCPLPRSCPFPACWCLWDECWGHWNTEMLPTHITKLWGLLWAKWTPSQPDPIGRSKKEGTFNNKAESSLKVKVFLHLETFEKGESCMSVNKLLGNFWLPFPTPFCSISCSWYFCKQNAWEKHRYTGESNKKNYFLVEKPHHNTGDKCYCWQELFFTYYQESGVFFFILVIQKATEMLLWLEGAIIFSTMLFALGNSSLILMAWWEHTEWRLLNEVLHLSFVYSHF